MSPLWRDKALRYVPWMNALTGSCSACLVKGLQYTFQLRSSPLSFPFCVCGGVGTQCRGWNVVMVTKQKGGWCNNSTLWRCRAHEQRSCWKQDRSVVYNERMQALSYPSVYFLQDDSLYKTRLCSQMLNNVMFRDYNICLMRWIPIWVYDHLI